MDNEMVSVTLAGPAKINGCRHKAGQTVSVSRGVARDLREKDLLVEGPSFDAGDVKLAAEFDDAVKLAVARALAEREAVVEENLSHLVAAHAEELAAIGRRADAAEAKAAELERSLIEATSRAALAEGKIADFEAAAAAKTDTRPVQKAGGKKP